MQQQSELDFTDQMGTRKEGAKRSQKEQKGFGTSEQEYAIEELGREILFWSAAGFQSIFIIPL